ncbi:kinase-like protein, partial [Athelia psychrophila]
LEIWSKLKHPHILHFWGANVWDEKPFIVMAYLKNGNARDYLEDDPECNRAVLNSIQLHQASLGLAYLHTLNIVHADLKGSNILIDDDRKAVLCDFGLSRVMADITSKTRKAGGEKSCGSVYWMAPERLLGGSLRKPSDIYSFGMTMYEIFMDETPLFYVLPTSITELVARENLRPDKPSAGYEDPHLPDEIWVLAERCWSHEPSDRP